MPSGSNAAASSSPTVGRRPSPWWRRSWGGAGSRAPTSRSTPVPCPASTPPVPASARTPTTRPAGWPGRTRRRRCGTRPSTPSPPGAGRAVPPCGERWWSGRSRRCSPARASGSATWSRPTATSSPGSPAGSPDGRSTGWRPPCCPTCWRRPTSGGGPRGSPTCAAGWRRSCVPPGSSPSRPTRTTCWCTPPGCGSGWRRPGSSCATAPASGWPGYVRVAVPGEAGLARLAGALEAAG